MAQKDRNADVTELQRQRDEAQATGDTERVRQLDEQIAAKQGGQQGQPQR